MQDAAESNSHETAVILGLLDGVSIQEVDPREVDGKLGDFTLIDVRSSEEFENDIGRLPKARLMPIKGDLRSQLSRLDREKPYLFICRSGGRSMRACRLALTLGFRNITNLKGGMLAWEKTALPMEQGALAHLG